MAFPHDSNAFARHGPFLFGPAGTHTHTGNTGSVSSIVGVPEVVPEHPGTDWDAWFFLASSLPHETLRALFFHPHSTAPGVWSGLRPMRPLASREEARVEHGTASGYRVGFGHGGYGGPRTRLRARIGQNEKVTQPVVGVFLWQLAEKCSGMEVANSDS